MRIWLNLFVNSLIPPYFAPNRIDIPPIPLQNPSQVIDRGQKQNESGLFSAFTSYISSYAADDPPEPSDEELESTLCTVDCVNACYMGDVFANVVSVSLTPQLICHADVYSALPIDSLKPLLQALLAQLPDDPSSIVINVRSEEENMPPSNGQKTASSGPVYDPSLVYILELCTVLTLRDEETVAALGGDVAEALQNVMRLASSYHHVIVSRAIFYLLHLLKASYVSVLRHPNSQTANIHSRITHSSVFRLYSIPYRVSRRMYSRDPHRSYSKV